MSWDFSTHSEWAQQLEWVEEFVRSELLHVLLQRWDQRVTHRIIETVRLFDDQVDR